MRHYAELLRATLAALFVLSAEAAVAGPLESARAAYIRGDYEGALWLLRPLVDHGNADAQEIPGVMYFVGEGVPQNCAEAVRLYRLAAEQGNSHAQDALGFIYRGGAGVQQDDAEAAKWFRRAADQGISDAQFNLGEMYELGTGVPKDYVRACIWFSLIAAGSHPYVAASRDRVAKQMTPEQIAEAQKLAREWKPKPER